MTGIFQIYSKKPKEGEVFITPPPPMEGHDKLITMPDMKDSNKFNYELLKSVEMPGEVEKYLQEWWWTADFCEEIIIRCELPV